MPFGRVKGVVGKAKGRGGKKRKVPGYLTNPSIKNKSLYAKLRLKGYSKTKSAMISNAKFRLEGLNANTKKRK